MKKRLLFKLLTAAMAGALLTGCGLDFSSKEDGASVEISKEYFGKTEEETHEEASEETTNVPEEKKDGPRGEELYEAFMNGDVKVVYNNLSNEIGDALKDYLEDGKEYGLDEIIKCTEDKSMTSVGDPKYVFIDCGEDGVKELLVKLEFEGRTSLSMILKDMDGDLKICYSGEEWERSELSISDTGMISSSGSGGATVHGYDASFVNAEGEYKFFYSCYTDGNPSNYYAYVSDEKYEEISFADLDTEYFMINRYCVQDDNGNSTYYYSYDMLDEDYNVVTTDADYDASNPYRKKFTDAGIKIYTKSEIDNILAKVAGEIGYPGGYNLVSEADDQEDRQYGIVLLSKEHVGESGLSAEDQTYNHSIGDVTMDITDSVDGLKGSSLDGRMKVSRIYNDDNEPVILFELDGKYVGTLNMETHDFDTFDYIQFKDIDGDGMEEILVVTYTTSTGPLFAVDFSVLKYTPGRNAADGSSYGITIMYHLSDDFPYGNGYYFIEADEELAGGKVTYVGLDDGGVKVVVDKGTKNDGVYEPDEYVLVMKY